MAKIRSGFSGERAIIIPSSVIDEMRNDVLGSLLHITDIGFYPHAGFHYRKRTSAEALQYILIYCVDGEGWFETDSKRHIVKADHFFIIPKGVAHTYGSNPNRPWSIYWIHFDGEKAAYFAEEQQIPTRIPPERNSRIEDRLHLFEGIFTILKNGYSKNHLDYSISCFFHFLGTLKFLSAFRASQSSKDNQSDILDDAVHFMRENLHKKLSVADIANYVGYSASHFTTLFHQKTGMAPVHYLTQLRIQQACHHLDFSPMKINQICALTGFDDPYYFSRIFHKTMGCSPSDYRKKVKG